MISKVQSNSKELIQSNSFAFMKWIPLYRKAYKYSQLIQPCNAGLTSILYMIIEHKSFPFFFLMFVLEHVGPLQYLGKQNSPKCMSFLFAGLILE